MSTHGVEPAPPSPSGVQAALRFTGLPVSWFSKRPKLPSRNWLIFIGVTSSLVGLYAYDRKKCRDIRTSYIQRVEHLSQLPMGSMELPRKVTVYACKWPGDEDASRGLRYFRKYIKPILVSAAVDYDVQNGLRHGGLARQIADRVKLQRRIDAGLETPPPSIVPIPVKLSKEEKALRELEGGSIIIGRTTFKEYMEGLRRGWTESPERIDREDVLAHALEKDGQFDEPELADPVAGLDGEPIPTNSRLLSTQNAQTFSPLKLSASASTPPSSPTLNSSLAPPSAIPPQSPLLLVPFTNYIGFKQIPRMIADFFNQRAKVTAGAEAAYRLIMGHTRPFSAPSPTPAAAPLFSPDERQPETDLDFDREGESYYQSSLSSFLQDIGKARNEYYSALPARLAAARALARGEREPTKEEQNHPPPSEVELREERMKKEMRWKDNEEGWSIIRPDKPVAWDERFRDALRVFVNPPGGH
ncbi:mitochondrial import inner membrane translocase subunit Tim54 [Phellopilus nigrolimitatus]|nr:mitochondrial import inner membrane translocase subunit Tim54 [Phellopilus nigrolimitatus]